MNPLPTPTTTTSGQALHQPRWLTPVKGLVLLCLWLAYPAWADDNPYSIHYQAQNQGNLHSLQTNAEPQLFSGTRRDEDNLRMLENGYDLMGFSQFEAGDVDPEQARSQGRYLQADAIVVYVKKASSASAASKMEVIKEAVKKGQPLTEKDLAAAPVNYRYYATYWAKLPPPLLGIHVIKLVPKPSAPADAAAPAAQASDGVRVIAVIHGSAAEKAGVQRGDQLLSIQREKVEDAATLSTLVRKYRGQPRDIATGTSGRASDTEHAVITLRARIARCPSPVVYPESM